jgi:hypothetical protein
VKHREKRAWRARLAASFVVTLAGGSSEACKKESDTGGGDADRGYLSRRGEDCTYGQPEHCPKGAMCNPPPPMVVDCPASLLDGQAEAHPARPPGKEGWIRVAPRFGAYHTECYFTPAYFCAPPDKPWSCASQEGKKLACTPLDGGDAGLTATRWKVDSFTYRDELGVCRVFPARECAANPPSPADDCAATVGDVVPCP